MLKHLMVPEPKHAQVTTPQPGITRPVGSRRQMLRTIHLNDQSPLDADEIHHERPHRMLSPEPVPTQLPPAQVEPEPLLGFGHFPAQCRGGRTLRMLTHEPSMAAPV